MSEYSPRKDFHETIQKARKLFPGENISYDLDSEITIDEFLANLKRRIAEEEGKKVLPQ